MYIMNICERQVDLKVIVTVITPYAYSTYYIITMEPCTSLDVIYNYHQSHRNINSHHNQLGTSNLTRNIRLSNSFMKYNQLGTSNGDFPAVWTNILAMSSKS